MEFFNWLESPLVRIATVTKDYSHSKVNSRSCLSRYYFAPRSTMVKFAAIVADIPVYWPQWLS